MQLHGILETLSNDKYYCLTHVPSPQNANLVMGARTSYMRLTRSCVEPFKCFQSADWYRQSTSQKQEWACTNGCSHCSG